MATALARAARRLAGSRSRGLSDALAGAGGSSAGGMTIEQQQRSPWFVSAVRAASGSPDSGAGSSGSGSLPPSTPATDEAGQTNAALQAASAAAETAAAATRARPPPGHADFTQRQLLMLFTCSKCNTRAAKAFSKQSYESGVVIVECPGCQSKHLIADNLGWFGQKGTVEQFAAERGGTVLKRTADGTLELTPEDLLGPALAGEAAAAVGQGGTAAGQAGAVPALAATSPVTQP